MLSILKARNDSYCLNIIKNYPFNQCFVRMVYNFYLIPLTKLWKTSSITFEKLNQIEENLTDNFMYFKDLLDTSDKELWLTLENILYSYFILPLINELIKPEKQSFYNKNHVH